MNELYKIRRHYFIFTEAGKPIYTRFGDEQVLAPFIASMSAIIPKITSYFWDMNVSSKHNQNEVRAIKSRLFNTTILRKGALFYICICNEQKSPNKATENNQYTREFFLDEKDFFS